MAALADEFGGKTAEKLAAGGGDGVEIIVETRSHFDRQTASQYISYMTSRDLVRHSRWPPLKSPLDASNEMPAHRYTQDFRLTGRCRRPNGARDLDMSSMLYIIDIACKEGEPQSKCLTGRLTANCFHFPE